METEKGIVEKTEGRWAWVLTRRGDGCGQCGQKGHCNASEQGMDRMIVRAENLLHARKGDEVQIYLGPGTRVKTIMIVYGLPVLGLLVGAISGTSLASFMNLSANAGAMLFSLGGFALAFVVARLFESQMKRNNELTPTISRITRQAAPAISGQKHSCC